MLEGVWEGESKIVFLDKEIEMSGKTKDGVMYHDMGTYEFDDQNLVIVLNKSLLTPEIAFEKPINLKFQYFLETGYFQDNTTIFSRLYPYWNSLKKYFGGYISQIVFGKRLSLLMIYCSDELYIDKSNLSSYYFGGRKTVYYP